MTLRARLRAQTASAHYRLDTRVSGWDLVDRHGLAAFLGMQRRALGALRPYARGDLSQDMMDDLHARAGADLTILGCDASVPTRDLPVAPMSLALDYVIAGSRLGSALLGKRWLGARDMQVRRASAYFSAPSYIEVWQTFCAQAARLPAEGLAADRIVCDANHIFQFYDHCASQDPEPRLYAHV